MEEKTSSLIGILYLLAPLAFFAGVVYTVIRMLI